MLGFVKGLGRRALYVAGGPLRWVGYHIGVGATFGKMVALYVPGTDDPDEQSKVLGDAERSSRCVARSHGRPRI
jgi:hypothetical protein